MGSHRIMLLTIACLGYVAGQRVEYMSPPVGTVTATPIVQPCGQFVIPAVIKPLLSPEPISEIPRPPSMPDFSPLYPPMMPPIIFQNDNDDNWHHLLYFLIFAMKNRNMGFNGYSGYAPPPMPYACYPCSGCGGGYDRCGCDDGFNNVNYVPYPVPVPMPSGGTIADPNLYPMPTDELTIIPSTPGQAVNPRDNEVTLLIRTEK